MTTNQMLKLFKQVLKDVPPVELSAAEKRNIATLIRSAK